MTSKRVVIITGVSRGIGLATARLFSEQGWVVVGTVRSHPSKGDNKGKKYPPELAATAIDVQIAEMTSLTDIERVTKKTFTTYGRIDAVVANAGYGLLGALDTLDHDQIVDQIAVNTVAVADLARVVLPIMRKQKNGVVVAVSSVAGRIGFPGYSIYNASKFAIEGMFEALSYEVEGSGIRVKLIEPSTVKTDFWGPSAHFSKIVKNYWTQRTMRHAQGVTRGLSSDGVAKVVYKAATDKKAKLHYPVGLTRWGVLVKRFLPDRWFRGIVKRFL